jgi:hypothetical protein
MRAVTVIEVSRGTSCSAFGEGLHEQQRRRTNFAVLVDELDMRVPDRDTG